MVYIRSHSTLMRINPFLHLFNEYLLLVLPYPLISLVLYDSKLPCYRNLMKLR